MDWFLYIGGWCLSTLIVWMFANSILSNTKALVGYFFYVTLSWTSVWIWICWRFI